MHQLFTMSCIRYATILGPKHLLQRYRHFSQKTGSYVKLKTKEFQVNPGYGIFRTNANVNCIIKPTNPQDYPDADRAFVYIYGEKSSPCQDINIELTGELKDVLTLNAYPKSTLMYCEVHLPIKYDLDVNLFNGADVEISGMEADEVNIKTDRGNIDTTGLKSHNIHIDTEVGNITAVGTLQGNIFITAQKTCLKAKRLQGMAMSIDAEELDTAIESSYMTQGEIKVQQGNIQVKNLHGCTDLVLRNGQVSISGLHGQISGFVKKGTIDVQVTDITSNSTLHLSEGDMNISILENPRHALEVTAPLLEIATEIKHKGAMCTESNQSFTLNQTESAETNKLIATVVKGTARLKCQDWFSTLGIKMT